MILRTNALFREVCLSTFSTTLQPTSSRAENEEDSDDLIIPTLKTPQPHNLITLKPQNLTTFTPPTKKVQGPNLAGTDPGHERTAATYSPALRCSTIGARGLNCSVRDGKRWNPAAVAA